MIPGAKAQVAIELVSMVFLSSEIRLRKIYGLFKILARAWMMCESWGILAKIGEAVALLADTIKLSNLVYA